MKISRFFPLACMLSLILLPACFNDSKDDSDYSEWRELNQQYFNKMAVLEDNGSLVYDEFTPGWDNSFSILMRWHNERNGDNLITPLSNSTCHVKYTLTNIDGDTLDSSASFVCVPNKMVTGFMAALMNMTINDTVTAILPFTAGYGSAGYSGIPPYSTLIFGIRLDSISKLF